MVKISTQNIEISVNAKYWPQHSIPKENHFFFVYFITIQNNSGYTVQVLKRHWEIYDTVGERRFVDGEGVVGETPVLEPGQKFEYNSGCNLNSEMGYMRGHYTLQKLLDGTEFNAHIPQFDLIVPAKWN